MKYLGLILMFPAVLFLWTKPRKEINAYYKMLRLMFELNQPKSGGIPVDIKVFLDGFHKYWSKYHSKEFRKKPISD